MLREEVNFLNFGLIFSTDIFGWAVQQQHGAIPWRSMSRVIQVLMYPRFIKNPPHQQ
jgi:hypothetical protein